MVPGATVAFALLQQKEYTASARLLFRDPALDQKLFGSTVFQPSTDPAREAATNVALVSLEVVAARTSRTLRRSLTPEQVQGKIQVASTGQSDLASITATDPNPTLAARLANAFAEQFILFRRGADRSKIGSAQRLVETELKRLDPGERSAPAGAALRRQAQQLKVLASLQSGNAELVQPALVPKSASSPKPVRNGIIGAFLGIMVGLGVALLLDRLDRRLRDPKEIEEIFRRPVLGAIPESSAISEPQSRLSELGGGESEAFRMLRANLRYFDVDRRLSSVLVISATPGEGKSTVAMLLAVAAARAGDRVLLLEADLRRPDLGPRLGVDQNIGLSQVLASQSTLSEAVQTVTVAGRGDVRGQTMDVLASGPIPPNPADLVESDRMKQLIHEAESQYDLVVIDTVPTSVVSDAIPLLQKVSGVILVSRIGQSTRDSARALHEQLENLNADPLGVVVNSVRRAGSYGYGGYGYGAEPEPRRQRRPAQRQDGHGFLDPDDPFQPAEPVPARDPQ